MAGQNIATRLENQCWVLISIAVWAILLSHLQPTQENLDLHPTIYITRKMNFLVLSLASFVLSTSTYVRASKHCRGVSLEAEPI